LIIQRFIGIPGLKTIVSAAGLRDLPGFESNIGREDRVLRVCIGAAALVALLFVKQGFLARYLLGLAAFVGLVTAYTKYSPVYSLIGENTRKKKGKKK